MMAAVTPYLAAMAGLFGLLAISIGVDRLYRRFARRHPECGPYRDKSKACQSCKGCS